MDKQQKIEQYLTETAPKSQLDIVLAFAEVKVRYGATQKEVAKFLGINDRSIRQYISNYKEEYEARLAELEEEVEPEIDISQLGRTITEEQLDKFVDSLFKSAITGSARDKQLFIEFTGLSADEVLTFQKNKAKSLRYWIRGELGSISQYMNTRTLGLMTESSELIYRGTKDSAKNPQNYVNKDVSDESFAKELMFWGLVHLNLLNGIEHPDTELMATAVRLDRVINNIPETFNKHEVKKYAKGEPISEVKKKVSDEEWMQMLTEIFGKDEAEEIMYRKRIAQNTVKAPEVVKVDVEQRATKYQDELEVLLTAEEHMKKLIRETLLNHKNN